MSQISLFLAADALVAGLLSAWFWLKASRVPIEPAWSKQGAVESGEHSISQDAWIAAVLQAASEAARLNKIAATWTAIAVVCGSIGAFIGALG